MAYDAITSVSDPRFEGALSRLLAIRDEARRRAVALPRFAEYLRTGYCRARAMEDTHRELENQRDARIAEATEKLLRSGRLDDPEFERARHTETLTIIGRCPKKLAARFEMAKRTGRVPKELMREYTRAILRWHQWTTRHTSSKTTEAERKKIQRATAKLRARDGLVDCIWHLNLVLPSDCVLPTCPVTHDQDILAELSPDDYLAVACYWITGLADQGSSRPIVPKPPSTDDILKSAIEYARWTRRMPDDRDKVVSDETLVRSCPVDVYSEMWNTILASFNASSEATQRIEIKPQSFDPNEWAPAERIKIVTGIKPGRLRMGRKRGQWSGRKLGRLWYYNVEELASKLPDDAESLRSLKRT